MKTNIKLRVTPEQSEAAQKICFANGFTWKHNPNNIELVGIGYHFLGLRSSDNTLWATGSNSCFTDWELDEINADLFIRTNGTCEEFITQTELDDMLNSKSKEDMFKQYGFEVPNFDCTILAKVNNDYIGYVINNDTVVALSWSLSGICYTGITYNPKHNLTPSKKPWYEICKYPVIVKTEDSNIFIIMDELQNYTEVTLKTLIPLTNSEIDQLKQDF